MNTIIKIATVICAGGLFTACATTTETQQVTTSTEQTTAAPATKVASSEDRTDGSRKVCKRTKVTGSNFKKKVCMTADQWASMREQGKKSTSEFQRRSSQVGNPKGG